MYLTNPILNIFSKKGGNSLQKIPVIRTKINAVRQSTAILEGMKYMATNAAATIAIDFIILILPLYTASNAPPAR